MLTRRWEGNVISTAVSAVEDEVTAESHDTNFLLDCTDLTNSYNSGVDES